MKKNFKQFIGEALVNDLDGANSRFALGMYIPAIIYAIKKINKLGSVKEYYKFAYSKKGIKEAIPVTLISFLVGVFAAIIPACYKQKKLEAAEAANVDVTATAPEDIQVL